MTSTLHDIIELEEQRAKEAQVIINEPATFDIHPELLPGGLGRVITINEVGDTVQSTVE